MKVSVYNIYSKNTNTFQGEPDQIKNQLNDRYSHILERYGCVTLQHILQKLSEQQSMMLEVTE